MLKFLELEGINLRRELQFNTAQLLPIFCGGTAHAILARRMGERWERLFSGPTASLSEALAALYLALLPTPLYDGWSETRLTYAEYGALGLSYYISFGLVLVAFFGPRFG